eukprot:5349416-Pleurochrysis_carterae.AAC.1
MVAAVRGRVLAAKRCVGKLATAAEAAVGTSVLVATDATAVAGADEAIALARAAETGRASVDVAAGAEDPPCARTVSRWST